jgi:hypothetical protein
MEDITKTIFNPADGFRYTITLPGELWKVHRFKVFRSLCKKLHNGEITYLTDLKYPWLKVETKKISSSLDDIVKRDEVLSNN